MAKTVKYETSSDPGLEMGLELPSFDFDDAAKKDDRNPAIKALSGVFKGLKGEIVNPNIIHSSIKNAMPSAYGQALDVANSNVASLRSIYSDAVKELRPAIRDLKRTTRKLLPRAEGVLPKKLQKFIKEWSEPETTYNYNSSRIREDSISVNLAEIFQAQAEDQARRDEIEEDKEDLKQTIEIQRHKGTLNALGTIADSAQQLVAYHNKITTGYQRKSLELQYRQYYATVDMLELQRTSAVATKLQLDDIKKNTGLPDFVKATGSEEFKHGIKNKFMNYMSSNLFGGVNNYLSKLSGNLMTNLKQNVRGFTDMVSMGAGAADELASSMEMSDALGETTDKYSEGGRMVGGLAGVFGLPLLQKWAGAKLQAHPQMGQAIAKGSEHLQYAVNNSENLLDTHLKSLDVNWGPLEWLRQMLAQNAPKTAPDTTLTSKTFLRHDEPHPYTMAANRSIVEIIPGYLARIFREIQVLRTGDVSQGLTVFDHRQGKFATVKQAAESFKKTLFSKYDQDAVQQRLSSIVEHFDANKTLSPEAVEALKKELVSLSLHNKNTDASEMSRRTTWRGAGEHADALAKLFREKFEVTPEGKRGDSLQAIQAQNFFTNQVKNLGNMLQDPRALIQQMHSLGLDDVLNELNLLNKNKSPNKPEQIDLNGLRDLMLEQRSESETSLPTRQPLKAFQSQSRSVKSKARVWQSHPVIAPQQTPALEAPPAAPVLASLTPATKPVEVRLDSKSITDRLDKLVEATLALDKPVESRASEQDSKFQALLESVTKIQSQLVEGVNVLNVDEFPGYYGSGDEPQGLIGRRKRLRDTTVGDLGGLAWRGGKGLAKLIGNTISTSKRRLFKASHLALRTATGVLGTVGGVVAHALHHTLGDLYVGEEKFPRLTQAKLKTGLYYFDSKTGKPLKDFKDIDGPVKDENGLEVLSADDLKTAYLKGNAITMLGSIAKKIGSLGLMGMINYSGVIKGGFALGLKAAMGAARLIKEHLPPFDVYVKGKMDKPVLFAVKMKMGGYYYSAKTARPITHPRDIDGPVKDKDGNFIVTEDDIEQGLVDQHGTSIRNTAARLLRKVGGVVKAGFNVFSGLFEHAKNTVKGVGNFIKDLFGGMFGLRGEYLQTSKKQLDVLIEIRKLLDNRLPHPQRIRANSADQLEAAEARRDAQQEAQIKEGERARLPGEGPQGGQGGVLSSLIKRLTGGAGKEAEAAAEGGAKEVAENIAAGAAGSKIGSLLKITKSLAGKGSKGLWTGLKWGATTALPWLATEAVPAIISGLGTLAAGAASVLSTPIVLAGLAIGAVGYGAYKLYKHFSKPKLHTLSTVRYAQYGFDAKDQTHLKAVFALEDELVKHVKIDGASATLDAKKVKIKDLADLFGVDASDDRAMGRWLTWVQKRFKPVLLSSVYQLQQVSKSASLSDVDSALKDEEKLAFLTKLESIKSSIYDTTVSPFPGHDMLAVDARGVKDAIEHAKEVLSKAAKASKSVSEQTQKSLVPAVAAVTTLAKQPGKKDATAVTTRAPIKPSLDTKNLAQKAMDKTTTVTVSSASGLEALFDPLGVKRVDALTAVRMRAYGLVELDQDRVSTLRSLENLIQSKVTFDGRGAHWNGDIQEILSQTSICASFGISGAQSPQGHDWMVWFQYRFLPVYLNYCSAVYKATGKTDVKIAAGLLTPQAALSVANVVKSTTGEHGLVWNLKNTPWPKYVLNSDPSTVQANVGFLEDAVKKALTGEDARRKVAANGSALKKAPVTAPAANAPAFANPMQEARTQAQKAITKARLSSAAANASPDYFSKNLPNLATNDFKGGSPIAQPGNGTGGDINKIPQAKGAGWDNVKATIIAAAKMAGVDAKLLAKYIAMESGFDPTAIPRAKDGHRLSNAIGLGQFIPSTWNQMMHKYANKYGINPATLPTDARAAALMMAEYIKENIAKLSKGLGRTPTETDVYLAYFLGSGGALQFLKNNPNAPAAEVMPKEAQSNPTVFYDHGTANTFGQVYQKFTDRLKAVDSKIKLSDLTTTVATTVPKATPSSESDGVSAKAENTQTTTPVRQVLNKVSQPTQVTAQVQSPRFHEPQSRDELNLSMPASVAATSPSSVKTSSVTAPAPAPVMRTVPNFAGFNTNYQPSTSEMVAQQAAVRNQQVALVKSIDQTLQASLQTQQETTTTLKHIAVTLDDMKKTVEVNTSSSSTYPSASAPVDAGASGKSAPIRRMTQMSKPPVSMDRTM